MKQLITRLTGWALPAICLFLAAPEVQAQSASAEIIKAGKYNANQYFKAYFQPGGEAFGHSLNSGWFNSAKAMGLGRFDVRVYGSVGLTGRENRTFDLSKAGFDPHLQVDGSHTMAPTVFGADEAGPRLSVLDDNGNVITSFNAPEGSGVVLAPSPMAQVSVGLIKDTEVAVRFIPTVRVDDYEGNLWGVGLKHGLKQWVPGLRSIPGFDIAAVGGYTSFETSARVNVRPDADAAQTAQQQQAGYYDNQQLQVNTKAWTAGLMVSKTVSVLTGYAGVRYSKATTDVSLAGNYPITSIRRTGNSAEKYVEDLVDPVSTKTNHGQFGLNAGVRLKLAIFSLYGEYTVADYSTASAGIGIGFN